MSKQKTRRSPHSRTREASPCEAPDCGRPRYARGLCQTHHRQRLTTGKLEPIRPYQRRNTETVKFSGLRLTPGCAELIDRKARRQGLSRGAAIADILQEWLDRNRSHG